jgi:adenylate cyclase
MQTLLARLSTVPANTMAAFRAPESTMRLPPRVVDLLHAQDRAAERLIIYVQLGLAAALAVLYVLAPRPEDAPMTMLAPVPFALAAYALFALVRLLLSWRGPLPGWFVIPSIVADMSLLLGLIWSFHLQYGEPPAFSLKVPSILYLFVFIALRALRFDHRYVLAAGLTAAIGWALLTMAAIAESPEGAVTSNFVAYITGNRILIGAEVDKIVAILLVTAVLTVGARRAQQTLLTAVREEAAGREIKRFLSRGVAEQISMSEELIEAGHAAERAAAIMMIDIRGFTPFSTTVPPAEVVRMLTSFHARIVPIVQANSGVVDKFLGDGVMVTFGAVAPSKSAAADALRALDAILEEALAWQRSLAGLGLKTPLHVNAAVASGTVVFATLGDATRLEYTVIGEAVNLAAKLEKHNKAEKTRALLPAATLKEARAQGYEPAVEPQLRPGAQVAGVSDPIDLFGYPA